MAVLATVVSYFPARTLKLDESIESFFSPSDPLLRDYLESKKNFGGDEFVLVAYTPLPKPGSTAPANLTSSHVLDESEAFAAELSRVPGVKASSTLHLKQAFRPPGVPMFFLRMPSVSNGIFNQVRGVLISEDRRTLSIALRLLPESQSSVPRRQTIQQIRDLAARHQPAAYVAGEPVQVQDMFLYVERDSVLLGITSTALLMLVIALMFRSLRWMILPLFVVHPTLLWTKGLLASTGLRLSMVSTMLTSLTTIIGVATVMHVAIEFREARQNWSRTDSLKRSLQKLTIPIFWTIVTTAIGFGSLLTSQITPVRSFGLMMLVSTGLVLVACACFLPSAILIGRHVSDPRYGRSEASLTRGLERLFDAVTTRRKTAIGILIGMSCVAAFGLKYVRVETDFSQNFRHNSPIVQSLDFFESKFGGVGSWEVNFSAPTQLDEKFLDRVRRLSQDLRQLQESPRSETEGQLTKVIALPDTLDVIPKIAAPTLEERRAILKQKQPEYEPTLYNPHNGRMRLVLRARERQPAEAKLQLIQRVLRIAQAEFPDAKVTGLYVLLANLISSLLMDQLTSFGLSVALIIVCVWIPFRRLTWAVIAMFPNVLPTLWLIGGMGWLGLPINIGTAMIASVSLGLTIDSSIHYLSAYQSATRRGISHRLALREASTHIGRALVLANAALVIGFSVLALSNFLPLVYFGVLVSFAMISGLIGNLVLLPSLMLRLEDMEHTTPEAAA